MYGADRVTVGGDEQTGRVRRHGEHEQDPARNRRLPGVGPVVTVTVAGRVDALAQIPAETVWHQHELTPSAAGT